MGKEKRDLILEKLDEMHVDIKRLTTETVPKLDKRIAVVETKTKIWSGLAGVMGGCLVFLSEKFMGK